MEKLNQEKWITQLGVGESIQVGTRWIGAVERKEGERSCPNCCFNPYGDNVCAFMREYILGDCEAYFRHDKKNIYFVDKSSNK